MKISNAKIDAGKAFDFGRTSADYAAYRDIYPKIFYEKIVERGLCTSGQRVLDLGTGTGVLPRNMYRYGAEWTGVDISEEQIAEARRLSEQADMKINFVTSAAEELELETDSFDTVTACQCFTYFDHERLMPRLQRILKPNGRLLVLYMASI